MANQPKIMAFPGNDLYMQFLWVIRWLDDNVIEQWDEMSTNILHKTSEHIERRRGGR